jgi:hypothetical protein
MSDIDFKTLSREMAGREAERVNNFETVAFGL